MFANHFGIRANIFGWNTGGERNAANIANLSAQWFAGDDPLRIAFRLGAQFVVPKNLKIDQPIAEAEKCERKQDCQQSQSEKLNCFSHGFLNLPTARRRSVPPPNKRGRR